MPVKPMKPKASATRKATVADKLGEAEKAAKTSGRIRAGYSRFNADLPAELHRKLQLYCALNRVKQNEVVIDLLTDKLQGFDLPEGWEG